MTSHRGDHKSCYKNLIHYCGLTQSRIAGRQELIKVTKYADYKVVDMEQYIHTSVHIYKLFCAPTIYEDRLTE